MCVGLIDLHNLASNDSTGNFTIVGDLIGTVLWICLAVVPFIQVHARARMCVCVCTYVYVCVHVCMCMHMCV